MEAKQKAPGCPGCVGAYRQSQGDGLPDICPKCGRELEDVAVLQAKRVAEEVVLRLQGGSASLPPQPAAADPTPGRLLTPREVAKALRVDRLRTLPKLVASGALHPVAWGRGRRFHAAEVEQLAHQGLAAEIQGVGHAPPPPRTTTAGPVSDAGAPEEPRPRAEAPRSESARRRKPRAASAIRRAISSIPLTTTKH